MEENGGGDYSYFEFIYFVLYFVNSIVTVGSVFGNVGGGAMFLGTPCILYVH